jgi:hypothetical protein
MQSNCLVRTIVKDLQGLIKISQPFLSNDGTNTSEKKKKFQVSMISNTSNVLWVCPSELDSLVPSFISDGFPI